MVHHHLGGGGFPQAKGLHDRKYRLYYKAQHIDVTQSNSQPNTSHFPQVKPPDAGMFWQVFTKTLLNETLL